MQRMQELRDAGMKLSDIASTCGFGTEKDGQNVPNMMGLYTAMLGENNQEPDEMRHAQVSDYIPIWQNGPGDWMSRGGDQFHYLGWIFYADRNHFGNISATVDVLAKYGLTDNKNWSEGDIDDFHDRGGWKCKWNKDGAEPEEYPDEYAQELAEHKAKRFCCITHCTFVEDPAGNELGDGDETPFGIIGSQEFTCWWNGIPHAMLAECDIDSWFNG